MGNLLCAKSAQWDAFLNTESVHFRTQHLVIKKVSDKSDSRQRSSTNDIEFVTEDSPIVKEKSQDHSRTKMYHVGKRCSVKDMRSRIELLKLLGSGSFGSVYLIRDHKTKSLYALKSMRKDKIIQLSQVQHILQERDVLSTIHMVFIMKLVGTFQDATHVHLILEYISGFDIYQLLRMYEKFNENTARFYAAQTFMALEYLHTLNILYRDLKPENLVINWNGYLKLVDFSFAKYVPTRTYTLCGTPDYMSPEALMHRGYKTSVDWWAFGVLVYELLYGYAPFQGQQILELYENIISGVVNHTETSDLSAEVKELIGNLIQVNVSKRFGTLRRGTMDIRDHAWFRPINWDSLFRRCVRPPILVPEPIIEEESVPMPSVDGKSDIYEEYFAAF